MKLSALVMTLALVGFVAHAQTGTPGSAPGGAPTEEGAVKEGADAGHGDHGDATKPHADMKDKKKKKINEKAKGKGKH